VEEARSCFTIFGLYIPGNMPGTTLVSKVTFIIPTKKNEKELSKKEKNLPHCCFASFVPVHEDADCLVCR
jgi:hypothetical protein